jgi:hypothetical protein
MRAGVEKLRQVHLEKSGNGRILISDNSGGDSMGDRECQDSWPEESIGQCSSAEQELILEVRRARAVYQQTVEQYKHLMECSSDLGLNAADGAFSLRQAIEAQRIATRRYSDALRVLSRFLLDRPVR